MIIMAVSVVTLESNKGHYRTEETRGHTKIIREAEQGNPAQHHGGEHDRLTDIANSGCQALLMLPLRIGSTDNAS